MYIHAYLFAAGQGEVSQRQTISRSKAVTILLLRVWAGSRLQPHIFQMPILKSLGEVWYENGVGLGVQHEGQLQKDERYAY